MATKAPNIKHIFVKFRVTPDQLRQFKKDASKRGLSLSAHVVNLLVTFEEKAK